MASPDQKRLTHFFPVLALLAGTVGIVLLAMFDPATSGIFPRCPLYALTGLYCPGCGSLRALHQLLRGNLYAAWAMNPLTVILLPFLTYGLASEVLLYWRGRGFSQFIWPAAWIRGLAAVIVLFGIARNLPVHPLDLLAPGALLNCNQSYTGCAE